MNFVVVRSAMLLIASNVFMTFAWYAHLRNLADRKWYRGDKRLRPSMNLLMRA